MLIAAGAVRWCTARMAKSPSSAPAAPSRWPVIDLVALTAIPSASAPKARRMAFASAMSPTGVEVACAILQPFLVVQRVHHRAPCLWKRTCFTSPVAMTW